MAVAAVDYRFQGMRLDTSAKGLNGKGVLRSVLP